MKNIVVTIDGPCAAGKTSTAKRLAGDLGLLYLDTGAIFRTVALQVVQDGKIDVFEACERAGHGQYILDLARSVQDGVQIHRIGDGQHMFLRGWDVTSSIRDREISDMASRVSVFPAIRDAVLQLERAQARNANIIAEGRDMGTVVFPKAPVKFFLTADPTVRAMRRMRDAPDQFRSLEHAVADIKTRDRRDAERSCAPLKRARSAIEVNNTNLSFEETVTLLRLFIRTRQ